jgi:micrococcal nuclease
VPIGQLEENLKNNMNKLKKIILILFPLLFLSSCSFSDFSSINWPSFLEPKSSDGYLVEKVVDGDTIKVREGKDLVTVRLIGLDTPEIRDPRQAVQCFAQEASDKAKEILSGQRVYLEDDISQGDKDKYQRLLRYVYLEDGTLFNQWMIENGYGHEYTYNIPYKFQAEFQEAERQAQAKSLGLWAEDACNDFDNKGNNNEDLDTLIETMDGVWKDLKDIFQNSF